MKTFLFLALSACMIGCKAKPVRITANGHQEALYVRDKSHGCVVVRYNKGRDDWDFSDHRVEYKSGNTVYACVGGVMLLIEETEEQP